MTDTQSPAAEQTSSAEPVDLTDSAASPTSPTTDATPQPEQTDTISAESAESAESAQAADSAGPAAGDLDDADDDAADGEDAEAGVDGTAPSKRKTRVQQLEREGEVAADFLETLLDIADLDGDIDVDVDGDRAAVAIVDSEEGRVPRRLVGTDGKVLEALQELTRLAVQVETGERSRLMLDVAGHRAERRTALVELAHRSIAEVKETGERRSLDPMTAFERKVVHDEVSAAGLVSESEGVEPRRHIVILPA
ncbi:spoIIIJ-associated protein [Terracoccus luteus]|uniref:SpoIIIJ-associated protein n=1 Tax=Terracoccus luteus TaxID=53356 RepID=A0A495Y2U8_9MICO|nr:spoIIIJ-associated protein [Terracoccus luteus]